MKGNSLFQQYWQVPWPARSGRASIGGGGCPHCSPKHPNLLCGRETGGSEAYVIHGHNYVQLRMSAGRWTSAWRMTKAPTVSW